MEKCQESRFHFALLLNTFFFLVSRDLLIYVADNPHLKECFAKDGSLDFLPRHLSDGFVMRICFAINWNCR